MRAALNERIDVSTLGRCLVLVDGQRHPDFAARALLEPSDWCGDAPVFAWGSDVQALADVLDAYVDRPVYLARPSGELSGPFTAEQAWRETRWGDVGHGDVLPRFLKH